MKSKLFEIIEEDTAYKPNLLLQTGIFTEDEHFGPLPIISKYFEPTFINTVEDARFWKDSYTGGFRGSLSLARILGHKYEYANALNFMPEFRKKLINPEVLFTDFADLFNKQFPLFVRPVSPFKEFSGNVYTKEKLQEEFDFLVQNKNVSPNIICSFCNPKILGREWRTIFINNKYVSGSQYMDEGELNIQKEIPENVVEFAKEIAASDYFLNKFEFIIDVGEVEGRLALVEINGFETASFYGADLDLVYKTWAASFFD